MRKILSLVGLMALGALTVGIVACDDSDGSDANSDTASDSSHGSDSATGSDSTGGTDSAGGTDLMDSDSATASDTIMLADQTIGSACTCNGAGCESAGVPLPAAGDFIVGCADVPAAHPGEVVCLRSYTGTFATDTFFANGYCALQAISNCVGAEMICNSAVFGEFETMTSCPAGTVLVEMSSAVEVTLGVAMTATMDSKVCMKACTADVDCRNTEIDPILANAATQYACLGEAGAQFCYDPRNLPATYTATAF